jgi:hypothetical protein
MSCRIKSELKDLVVYGGLAMLKRRLTSGTWSSISVHDWL